MQVNSPMRSRQVASFWQGMDRHSLMSISQRGPAYPRPHWHWKEPSVFTHLPKCSHGLAPVGRKLAISIWNTLKEKESGPYKHKTPALTKSRLTNWTLIHVLVAGTSYKASRTGANCTTIKRVGVTHCALIAGVTHTCIIKVAQQTCGESTEKNKWQLLTGSYKLAARTKRGTVALC